MCDIFVANQKIEFAAERGKNKIELCKILSDRNISILTVFLPTTSEVNETNKIIIFNFDKYEEGFLRAFHVVSVTRFPKGRSAGKLAESAIFCAKIFAKTV